MRILCVGALSIVFCVSTFAQSPPLSCTNYITVIADNGLVVDELNADEKRAPASMVKLILVLMVAEGLETGKWGLDTEITVSVTAQSMGGTQVQIKAGDVYSLDTLMQAVCVASANDGSYAVAEGLWGDEATYLAAANVRAQELGMANTTIRSVHGLPPSAGELADDTTARDMATLSSACVMNTQIMKWVGMKELVFRPGEDPKQNTNKLLARMDGCDGLKTGYTRAAGFCLTATAMRNDVRLITVVMGCPRLKDRFDTADVLMEDAFTKVRRVRLLAADSLVDPAIAMGQQAGTVTVKLAGRVLGETPLRVPMAVEEPSVFWKLTHRVREKADEAQPAFGG